MSIDHIVENAGESAKNDATIKTVLGHKILIARILKALVPEFHDLSEHEIKNLVEPSTKGSETIVGLRTESTIDGDSKINFDMLFDVAYPNGEALPVNLFIVNMEPQAKFMRKKPYPMANRMMAYVAREIATQKIDTSKEDAYANIKPVVSIWIFTGVGRKWQNTICSILPYVDQIYGEKTIFTDAEFGLARMYAICLGNADDAVDLEILHHLNIIMDGSLDGAEKMQRLSNAYSQELVKEVKDMTTYMEKQMEARIRPQLEREIEASVRDKIEASVRDKIEASTRDSSFVETVCNIFKTISDPKQIAKLVCRDEDDVRVALIKGGVFPPAS